MLQQANLVINNWVWVLEAAAGVCCTQQSYDCLAVCLACKLLHGDSSSIHLLLAYC
jgi:hypothetical protein